jgi:ferredoxin-NADP reductase
MALFPIRRFRIVERRQDTPETFSIMLEPADGEPLFAYKAGQFVMMHLFNPDGSVWAKAAYSLATAPIEATKHIELGIKIHGDFTKRVSTFRVGNEVGIQGPYGAFTLKDDADRYVFFAGGIGVTPLRSMIRDVLLAKKPVEMVLLYSDKTRADMAYEAEFRDLAATHPQFRFIPVLTRETPDGWDGETSRINRAMIEAHVPDLERGRYYVCGPHAFMDMMKTTLAELGVDTSKNLQKESF